MPALLARGRRVAVTGLLVGGLTAGMMLSASQAQAAPAKNLIFNSSAESVVRQVPRGWAKSGSGVNTRVLTVRSGGAASGGKYVRTTITRYRSGAAWWLTPWASVRAGSKYTYTESYRSNRPSKVNAYFLVGKRVVGKQLAVVPAASRWRAVQYAVTVPAGASKVRFGHSLSAVGYVDVDKLSLVARAGTTSSRPVASSTRGLISLTFDDGWTNQYTNAYPILKSANVPGTFYLISGYLGSGAYMSVAQAKQIQAAGSEIGSHTVTHARLTTATSGEVTNELANSKATLEANFGPVTSLAYPYGSSNADVQAEAARYYTNARSTNPGLMTKGRYNKYGLTIGYVLNTTPLSQVQAWINEARANDTWLVLCYHQIANDRPDDTYTISVKAFQDQVNAVKAAGVRTVTVRDAVKLTS